MKQALEPRIPVIDIWPRGPSQNVLSAYKACIDAELIRTLTVRVDPDTKFTIINYLSAIPEEWIHDSIKDLANSDPDKFLECAGKVSQMKFE